MTEQKNNWLVDTVNSTPGWLSGLIFGIFIVPFGLFVVGLIGSVLSSVYLMEFNSVIWVCVNYFDWHPALRTFAFVIHFFIVTSIMYEFHTLDGVHDMDEDKITRIKDMWLNDHKRRNRHINPYSRYFNDLDLQESRVRALRKAMGDVMEHEIHRPGPKSPPSKRTDNDDGDYSRSISNSVSSSFSSSDSGGSSGD